MLLADRADVPPDADDAIAARATPTRTTALMVRALMTFPPSASKGGRVAPASPRGLSGRERIRLLAYTTWPRGVRVAHLHEVVKTTLRNGEVGQIDALSRGLPLPERKDVLRGGVRSRV